MGTKEEATKEVNFEQSIENLQKIVRAMEGGQLSIEESLRLYEEGIRITRDCHAYLGQAEKKIELLAQKPV